MANQRSAGKLGLAILLMLCTTLCFAALDATSKYLSRTYPIPMLVWGRYSFHFLIMMIFLAPSMRWKLVATQYPIAQITRGFMLVGTTGFSMVGFSLMPLAESTALLFVTPLIVVILSHWLLKESITVKHWLAVLAGFGGALLIARPGGALNQQGIVWMTLAAACYSIYQIKTRQLSPTENSWTMLFYTALIGTISMTLSAPIYWGGPTPDWGDAILIASLGAYGGAGHLLMIRAFRYAAASLVSPLLYAQLIWSVLLGMVIYHHTPDLFSLMGMLIIAASSISVAILANQRANQHTDQHANSPTPLKPEAAPEDRDKAC